MPQWSETLDRIGEIIDDMGDRMQAAQSEMEAADKRGKGAAGRLTAFRRLAQDLSGPGDEVLQLSSEWVQQLNAVDGGVRAIVDMASSGLASGSEHVEDVREFFESIRNLSESSAEGLGSIDGMLQQMEPIEALSRDLRPVLKKYRQGLTDMAEGRAITDAWVELIDGVDLDNLPGATPGESNGSGVAAPLDLK